MPLQLVGSATGFVLAVLLYRLFAPGDPLIALALLPLALIHYVIQGVGQVRADADTLRLALARGASGHTAICDLRGCEAARLRLALAWGS